MDINIERFQYPRELIYAYQNSDFLGNLIGFIQVIVKTLRIFIIHFFPK